MKKVLLFASAALISTVSVAQQSPVKVFSYDAPTQANSAAKTLSRAKITKNGDTLTKSHIISTDGLFVYYAGSSPFDSGYIAGYNALGYKGYAERFDIKGTDSSVQPLGVAIYFAGSANAGSTKNVRGVAWAQGPTTTVSGRPHLFFKGVPSTVITSSPSVTLGNLRDASGDIDSLLYMPFPVGGSYVADSFFVGCDFPSGYTFSSLGGDTLIVVQNESKAGGRHGDGGVPSPGYIVSGADTIINVQNASQTSTGTWVDNLNGGGSGLYNNYVMFAVFRVKITTGINNGISRNDLTVFGTYPNPANNSSKLKLSLKSATDVTLQIMDMSGRIVRSAAPQHLGAGTHELPVSTSELSTGTYYCLVRTSAGDAMGIEMTVVH